ncbi:MAG TPA: fibronectin type III domain-containing protein, partial [Acidimicrobiales bacterium]|nr:fibronectin type III domain-containing protein [Acidimicrobiales bacterium]
MSPRDAFPTEHAGDEVPGASHTAVPPVIRHRSPFGDLSRRDFMKLAAGAGFGAVAAGLAWPEGYAFAAGPGGVSSLGPTTPEQVHLTFGSNPASAVTVSWAAANPEITPQVTLTPP